MPDGEPTLGEVSRQMANLAAQMTILAQRMTDDRREYDKVFVREREYDIAHKAIERRVDDLEDDHEADRKFAAETRRQLMFLILGAFATALGALIVAAYLGGGGPQ
jgi:hypothetical protein